MRIIQKLYNPHCLTNKKMKKITIIYLIFLSTITNAQTLKGIYITQNQTGIGGDSKISEKAKIPKLYKYTYSKNKSNLVLLNNGGKIIDTLKKKLEEYNFEYETVETTITASKVNYFKDFNKKVYEKISVLENTETYIKDSIPQINWKITGEKKSISGYECTKAIADRKVMGYPLKISAWFCDKIPINDGPFDFQGLPGFILELSVDGLSITKFVNLEYDENTTLDIQPEPSNEKPKTVTEFEKSIGR